MTKIVMLKTERTYRGARAEWYDSLRKYDGKSLDKWEEHVTANPPSLPTKGKSAGKAEKPSGWLRFFSREGVVSLTD